MARCKNNEMECKSMICLIFQVQNFQSHFFFYRGKQFDKMQILLSRYAINKKANFSLVELNFN